MRRLLVVLPLLLLFVAGCNDWERNTFQTLASSKAVIDTAQNDYEAKTIPQNSCTYKVINDGKAAQTAAVDAMITYEQLKATKGNFADQQVIVTNDLFALAPLVAQIQSLVSNPKAACIAGAK